MPEIRYYNGQVIRSAKRIYHRRTKQPMIRIILKSAIKGNPGRILTITPEEYEGNVVRKWVSKFAR